ncbi:MAG TPA: DNA ligase [Kofleriaceae bacterium]|nr:DNA ligase [Kofleriaceae bacterium]
MTKEKPWWKRTPEAAPDAPRAVRPADEPESEPDDDDDGDGDDDDADDDHDDDARPAPAATASGPRDIADGESVSVQGSGAQPYILKNIGGVYSCSCPAWRNQGGPIDRRTCKHLRAVRGDLAETARIGVEAAATQRASAPAAAGQAPPILLAHPWDQVADLTGWWMSEKLDGVRAYWNGSQFISRLGNAFFAPDWFAAKLPDTPLDGELWAGRKKFQRAVSIARRQDRSNDWRELSYVVFDAPAHGGPFEDRLEHVRGYMEANQPPHARWHPHERCSGVDHIRTELARVESLGGEGLMMRQPGSRYEIGRSWTLRKVKTFHDAEARVIAHVRGGGRHEGRLGSLQCEMPNGTTFNVGTGLSDDERNHPPPVGSIITYRYQELSNDGVPRFPSYVGVRHDVAWPPPAAAAAAAAARRSPSAAAAAAPVAAAAPAAAAAAVPAAVPAAAAPAPAAASASRRFTRGDAIWSISLDGRAVKILDHQPGSPASETTRHNSSPAAAWRDADRLIAEKLRDGYVEVLT